MKDGMKQVRSLEINREVVNKEKLVKGKSQDGQQGKDGNGKDGKNGQGKMDKAVKKVEKERMEKKVKMVKEMLKAIMEIYKEQVKLREALQNELTKKGLDAQGKSVIDQMKASEKQILNKGFKNENLQRILNIQQELLKLNNAVQQQGQDTKRQSETNKAEFSNRANALPSSLNDYLNSVEILNRQSLPLRSNFNQKVQEYFNTK